MRSLSRYLASGNTIWKVRTLPRSKPISLVTRVRNPFTIKPAPTSKTKESAISETTSKVRKRRRLAVGLPPREPSFRVSFTLGREKCHAGARPATMPVIMATRSVNKNTRESICKCFSPAMCSTIQGGMVRRTMLSHQLDKKSAHQHQNKLSRTEGEIFDRIYDPDSVAGIGFGILFAQARRNCLKVRLRLRYGNAILHPSEDCQIVILAVFFRSAIQVERSPNL